MSAAHRQPAASMTNARDGMISTAPKPEPTCSSDIAIALLRSNQLLTNAEDALNAMFRDYRADHRDVEQEHERHVRRQREERVASRRHGHAPQQHKPRPVLVHERAADRRGDARYEGGRREQERRDAPLYAEILLQRYDEQRAAEDEHANAACPRTEHEQDDAPTVEAVAHAVCGVRNDCHGRARVTPTEDYTRATTERTVVRC